MSRESVKALYSLFALVKMKNGFMSETLLNFLMGLVRGQSKEPIFK